MGAVTAQDKQTIRDASGLGKNQCRICPLYAAAVARRQADQIYNHVTHRMRPSSWVRATEGDWLSDGVKTATLALCAKRELEIRNFGKLPILRFIP